MDRRDYRQLLSVAIAGFLFKQYFTPTNYCVAVVWQVLGLLCFLVFLQVKKKMKSRVYKGCGFYENIAQLHVSDKTHCLLAAAGTSQSIFSLLLLLPSFPCHSGGHHHLQSGCCSNRILL